MNNLIIPWKLIRPRFTHNFSSYEHFSSLGYDKLGQNQSQNPFSTTFWVQKILCQNFFWVQSCWAQKLSELTCLTWLDLPQHDLTFHDLTWLDPNWLALSWLELTCLDWTWPVLTSLYLPQLDFTCPYLTCPDLTCSVLTNPDLNCSNLTCPDLTCL